MAVEETQSCVLKFTITSETSFSKYNQVTWTKMLAPSSNSTYFLPVTAYLEGLCRNCIVPLIFSLNFATIGQILAIKFSLCNLFINA